jgi:tetratricopeptide (TPR) repeat protein
MASEKIDRIKKILALEPESEMLWFSLGQAYLAEESPVLAVEAFEKAIAIKPDYTVVYEHLGGALEKIGKMDEAMTIYRKGIEVGQKTGDMVPLERMTARLHRLEKGPRQKPAA